MNFAKPMDYLRDRLKTLKIVLSVVGVLAILFDIVTPRHEAHFFGDPIRGFWTIFGFVGCIVLIRLMKGIGHLFLMKKEDYYE